HTRERTRTSGGRLTSHGIARTLAGRMTRLSRKESGEGVFLRTFSRSQLARTLSRGLPLLPLLIYDETKGQECLMSLFPFVSVNKDQVQVPQSRGLCCPAYLLPS